MTSYESLHAAIKATDSLEALAALIPSLGNNEKLLEVASDHEGLLVELDCFGGAIVDSKASVDSAEEQEDELEIGTRTAAMVAAAMGPAPVAVTAPVQTTPAAADSMEAVLAAKKALRTDLIAKILRCADADWLTTVLVPELELATRAADLKLLRGDVKATVQARLKAISGRKPTAADMKQMFPDLATKAKAKFASDMSHHGIAQRVVAETDGDLRYNIDAKNWLLWDGRRWMALQDAQVSAIARNTANRAKDEALLDPAVDPSKLEIVGSDGYRRGVVGEMVASEKMHVEQTDLNTHVRYLTCGNGAIDLYTGNLVCERDLLATFKNETDFRPDAQCPTFLRILNAAFEGRETDIKFYELVMGYTLMGDPSERAMFFHIGEGTNGKSLLLGAIMKALGEHAVAVSYKVIADGPGMTANTSADGPSPSMRRLMAKRFAFIDELPMGGNLRDADVKKLAGGDGLITARGMRENDIEFPLTAVFNVACNSMPTIRGGQGAVWKRAFPIAYTKQFDDVEDTTLSKKLSEEREGILAWLVSAAGKYNEMKAKGGKLRDFMPPTSIAALENLKAEQNPFAEWVAENCEIDPLGFLSAQDGYESYIRHAQKISLDGARNIRSKKAFVMRMKSEKIGQHVVGYGIRRQAGFIGLRLKHCFD